jgi:osmotically-inducible protein OsmY
MLRNAVPDKTLLQNVSQRLMRLGGSSHNRCTAVVIGGDVTLSGMLQYEMQRKPLIRAATSVAGVRRVIDQLQVSPPKKRV